MLTVGSLFSGIGGIELGFHLAGGFDVVWFVESDPYAQSVLRRWFPGAALYNNVARVNYARLPVVDVITAGFPCQDISTAGKGAGIAGRRSGLYKYSIDALRVLRPRIGVLENVAMLRQRGLATVLADLSAIGYDAEWYCIPAKSVGAPHARDRIFILAYPDGSGHVHGKPHEHAVHGGEPPRRDAAQSRQDGDYTRITVPDWDTRGHWAAEPGMGRMAHGVPDGMDRLRCLGNAVVPAVAQAIAEAIKLALARESQITG